MILAILGNQTRTIKGIQVAKGEVKLSLFAGYMIILYTENSKDDTKKLLELINGFGSFKIQEQYTEICCIAI